MNKNHRQLKQLTAKDIQSMSNDEIISYVHHEHERLKVPADDIWDEMSLEFKVEIADRVISESHNPSDFRHTFSGSEWIMNVAITYVFAFGLIWLVLYNLMENKFNAMQSIVVVCGVGSILITATFLHLARKTERNYLDAVNSLKHLQEAYSTYIYRKDFKDSSDKPLDDNKNGN